MRQESRKKLTVSRMVRLLAFAAAELVALVPADDADEALAIVALLRGAVLHGRDRHKLEADTEGRRDENPEARSLWESGMNSANRLLMVPEETDTPTEDAA